MNCQKCGAELADDAKFCPQCGARVDGKTECPGCGREIAENSVYCTYCGKRIDGKKVCRKCGEVYDGVFCPQCGEPASAGVRRDAPRAAVQAGAAPASMNVSVSGDAAVAAEERKAAARMRANRVMSVIKQSLLYGALFVLFICSFFVTFSMTATMGGESESIGVNSTSFYFLIDIFDEVKDTLAAMGTLGEDYFSEMEISLYLAAGLSAASAAAIILICLGYFIAGTIAYVRAMTAKREIAMSKYVITPAVLSLVLMIFLKGLFNFFTDEAGVEQKLTLGAGPVANIVLVSVMLAGAAVLHIVIGGRSEKQNALGYALQASGTLLAFLAIVLLPLSVIVGEEGRTSVGLSAPAMFFGFLGSVGLISDETQIAAVRDALIDSAVVFALYVAVFVLAAVAMVAFAKGIVNKSGSCRTAACVFSGVALGVSVAYLAMSIVLCNDSETAQVGASPICALIFTVLALVMSIVNICLLRKKREEPVPGEYTE